MTRFGPTHLRTHRLTTHHFPPQPPPNSEQHGGGRCQVEGCDKLHQGKQGLESLFFCRHHRQIYRDVFRDGEETDAVGADAEAAALLVFVGGRRV
jgi:hypothetical protein